MLRGPAPAVIAQGMVSVAANCHWASRRDKESLSVSEHVHADVTEDMTLSLAGMLAGGSNLIMTPCERRSTAQLWSDIIVSDMLP